MNKVLKTALVITLGLVIGGVSYLFKDNISLFSADVLSDMQATPGDVTAIEFVTPKSTVSPNNNVVTIETVYVEFSAFGDHGNLSGSDLVNSTITFVPDGTEPVGTIVSNNKIILPSADFTPFDVDIDFAALSPANSVSLTITPATCHNLKTSILRGYGEGVYNGTETLPTAGVSDLFDFAPVTFATGTVTVTAGGAGDTYLVSIGSNSGTSVVFDTDLDTTASAIASDITDNITGYTASSSGSVVTITANSSGTDASVVSTAVTGTATTTDAGMSGGGVSVPEIGSINLNYPIPQESGQQTFALTFNFTDTLVENRAEIVSNSGDGIYEITVRDEGDDTVATSENFVYAINDLLGIPSPFIASLEPGSKVQLITKELGDHSDDYECMINNVAFGAGGNCFSGGTDGDVDLLMQPLTLDNKMVQGETAIIYAAGGVGITNWGTSHPSVMEVAPFSEISGTESGGSVQFIPEAYQEENPATIQESNGTYNISCETEYVPDTNPAEIDTYSCDINFTIPVVIDSQDSFDAIVYLGDEDITVPMNLEGGELTGTVSGSGTYTSATGLSLTLEGQVSGNISGTATGPATGTIAGVIYSDININASVDAGQTDLSTTNFVTNLTTSLISVGTIKAEEGFISTVKLVNQEAGLTNYAVLYAKRDGTSILTVSDDLSCVAAFEVEVVKRRVILDMIGKDPSDIFELGESVQINAYLGSADGEIDENQNITSASGIEWVSSNPDVATVDSSGVLSIVAPGITNIKATYYIGDAEIDPIESDPMTINVSKITGLTIALDEAAQAVMSNAELDEAYQSVLLVINNPVSAGRSMTVEGETFNLTLPTVTPDYSNDLERVTAIASQLKTRIEAIAVNPPTVSTVVGLPGVLILQPNAADTTGRIEVTTMASKENLTILPNFANGISLPASETFGLMVIADYDNGRTKRLATTDVTWVNTPLNYLDAASLEAGLLKLGEITGTSKVIAKYLNADDTTINSNQLFVNVGSGPVIEYARRLQSGPITQGSRINLISKVTDVDTIADISEITTSIVRSTLTTPTYQQLNSDPNAVWFTAEPFIDEVTVESESNTSVSEGTEGETTTPTATVVLNYKTYKIPVEIPVDEYLYNGNYFLILSIADANNHTANAVLPIYIGQLASGDVNGDGSVNMVDVITAFQIATGTIATPTQAQLEAADIDHMGGVTMIDVILLFNRATSN